MLQRPTLLLIHLLNQVWLKKNHTSTQKQKAHTDIASEMTNTPKKYLSVLIKTMLSKVFIRTVN